MPNKKLNYYFDSQSRGATKQAWNDPLTTGFDQSQPLSYYLARESLQNIMDAEDENNENPVRAEFDLYEVDAKELPRVNKLKNILERCIKTWPDKEKIKKHYGDFIKKIENNKKIKILKISDYNTVGLTGNPEDKDSNYFNLLRVVGGTGKSPEKMGSFGLGKGAYYTASSLGTIFIKSIFNNNEYVFKGKLRLVDHEDKEGIPKSNDGSYSLPEQKEIRRKELTPELFKRKELGRDENGTDIFVVGYRGAKNWKEMMIKSILNYFWLAIVEENLEVKVRGEQINSNTISKVMKKYFDDEDKHSRDKPNPFPFYTAYADQDKSYTERFTEELPRLGKVELYVALKKHYPKRVACMRNSGMVIEYNRKRCLRNYAGVFVCREEGESDKRGGGLLRKMENTSHDEWSSVNVDKENQEIREAAEEAEDEIRDFLRNAMDQIEDTQEEGAVNVKGLERFLPDDEDLLDDLSSGKYGEPQEGEGEKETVERKQKEDELELEPGDTVSLTPQATLGGKEDEDGENKVYDEGGNEEGDTPGKEEKGKEGDEKLIPVEGLEYKTYVRKLKSGYEHVIVLQGDPDQIFSLKLIPGTERGFGKLKIKKAESLTQKEKYSTVKNEIHGVSLDSDGYEKISVFFESNMKYSLRITAYEN